MNRGLKACQCCCQIEGSCRSLLLNDFSSRFYHVHNSAFRSTRLLTQLKMTRRPGSNYYVRIGRPNHLEGCNLLCPLRWRPAIYRRFSRSWMFTVEQLLIPNMM